MLLHGPCRQALQGAGGGVALPAASASAGTGLPVVDDAHVAHLAGHAVSAVIDLSVVEDARSHAGPQRDGDKTLAALAGSGVVFRQRRTVGVILHIQGVGQIPVEELAEGDVPQGQIAGIQHRTGVDLHRSRHTHAHGAYLLRRQAAPLRQALSQRHQRLHQCFLVGDLGNFALFHGEDAALVVHQPRLQVGAADVNADVVHFCSSLCRVRASIWRSTRSTKSLAGL